MLEPRNNGGRNGRIADLLGRVLAFVDRPWKAAFVLGVIVLCAVGWAAWQERDRLFALTGADTLRRAELPKLLPQYLHDADADIVAVWSIDVHANGASFERGYKRSGPWEFVPPRVPFIIGASDPKTLIQLFAGHTVCATLSQDALFARRISMTRLWEAGMRRICVTPIPSSPFLLLGLLVTAWHDPPSPGEEEAASALATTVADKLANWR